MEDKNSGIINRILRVKKCVAHRFKAMHFSLILLIYWLLSSCSYVRPEFPEGQVNLHTRDSLTYLYQYHYTWNTNLELRCDSVDLACLPLKGKYCRLYKGDRVVVAEFAVDTLNVEDGVWVKLAHSQEVQGWLPEARMKEVFVPTDSVSEFIYVFSQTHVSYFLVILSLLIVVWLFCIFSKKQLLLVYFNDIDSVYPLLLCLLMAFSATIYETMQVFVPETWEHYYYNPTLSPFQVPFILSVFLSSLWLFVIVLLATLDDLFRQLTPIAAFSYLLGLISCCIFCYFFFILTTYFYVGYIFLLGFVWIFLSKLRKSLRNARYRCGACGQKMRTKGVCPHCGVRNC